MRERYMDAHRNLPSINSVASVCERVRTESDLGRLVSDGAIICRRRVRPVARSPLPSASLGWRQP